MTTRTRVTLGRREDLGADCANCFGLCCVALAFTRSVDFPVDKPAGDPCTNLDGADACTIHPRLRAEGFRGCTVFDCSGAGQKVSRHTFAGRSWRDDDATRQAMFAAFPVVRRLHELLRYLDEAITITPADTDAERLTRDFERVRALSDADPDTILGIDVDAEYDAARPLLLAASRNARALVRGGDSRDTRADERRVGRLRVGPGADLVGADLVGADLRRADLRGASLRGALLIGADLTGAELRSCECIGADLRDADLSGADLRGAVFLTQMQVNAARGDADTRLDDGFQRPTHWGG
ncbi:pentapeptide repeat-containing protein [Curtobacterium sp. MCPF17_050]|uniref:pentapeptide repeat-containing protein n=1 Tax=Curtobacterium sp. MCPF17_050 TaxID=2175664 RepID=UPI000D8CF24D|nr:pentapeptide repeat-containing protein [Curtobacterium sp. MCPF17_050]WIB14148.1 pentapeptide repeat-containing protein [Curtobacterium sp. MCPF17_050]